MWAAMGRLLPFIFIGGNKTEFRDFSLFLNDTKVARFAGDLAAGRLTATRCKGCGAEYYPPRADCPQCMSDDMEWFEPNRNGKLATYTIIYVAPDHFAGHPQNPMPFAKYTPTPCPLGIMESESGLRVTGWMPNIKPQDIKVGINLRATPQVLPNGKVTITLEPA
jgi:hypothetical protein